MIDFSKITKTVSGLDCYYLGQRTSGGKVIHRFAIVNDTAEMICYYNEQGQKIEFSGAGGWLVDTNGHQIIAPPKIVEVTKWIGLYKGQDDYFISHANSEEVLAGKHLLSAFKHTFRFEVPNERR